MNSVFDALKSLSVCVIFCFSGSDIVQWMQKNLNIEDQGTVRLLKYDQPVSHKPVYRVKLIRLADRSERFSLFN